MVVLENAYKKIKNGMKWENSFKIMQGFERFIKYLSIKYDWKGEERSKKEKMKVFYFCICLLFKWMG